MKMVVIYYSETGNTKKVADAIVSAIGGEVKAIRMGGISSFENYDFIFLGFPIHEFGMPRVVKEFLNNISNKKIAFFITHAMPKNAPLFDRQMKNCKSALGDNELIDLFSCKGELSAKTALQMAESENESMRHFSKMRVNTVNHPNQEDLHSAKQFTTLLVDSKTANNAGVKFIATLTGVTSKEEFEKHYVDKTITCLTDLCLNFR
jgi:flavodoxin